MRHVTRRTALFGAGAVLGGVATRSLAPERPSVEGTASLIPSGAEGTLNDASGLMETPVFRHVTLKDDPDAGLIASLRKEMAGARADGRPINIGAARHSMGGQAIPRNGHAVTFDNGTVDLDSAAKVMRVHAGARWREAIAALDPRGFGPKVMQSNHDFGVAATFCVNAHGWPVKLGPMGATVRGFDLLTPQGDVVTCSRAENADLFGMTMGGYGLTGAILHMDVEVAENLRLIPSFETLPARDFGTRFVEAIGDGAVNMAYGRLNVGRARFFEEALMIAYRPAENQDDLEPASGSGLMAHLASYLYRAQLHNEPMKRLRWWTERTVLPMLSDESVTRNSLINEPVVTLDDRDPLRTDILHEYFVAPERFADFVDLCRRVIPASYQEFLNVTLRFIDTDATSWLSYAPVPRIAAVMSFSQEMTTRAEADMARMTQALIDGITGIGGTYYLPYRPHATQAQFVKAYPRAAEFAAAKRALDPDLLFRSVFWDNYLESL